MTAGSLSDVPYRDTTLGAVVADTGGVIQTGPFGSQLHARDYVLSGVPLVMPVNLGDNEIVESGIARVGASDVRRLSRHILRENDIVFSRRGDVGRRSIVKASEEGWLCGTGCLAARFGDRNDGVNPSYVAEYLGLPSVQTWLLDNSVGGTMPNLNTSILAATPIRIPERLVQDQIVEALGAIGASVAKIELLITKKQAIKQGMMQKLLTGETRLPSFSQPWTPTLFENIAAPVRDRTLPGLTTEATMLVEMEHLESGGGRLSGRASAQDAVSLKTVFQSGDVLFGKLRAYLRKFWLANSDGICSTEIWALRARSGVHSAYVRYLVETDRFIELASEGYGTHMPRSDWGTLRGMVFNLPPEKEQVAIAGLLRDVDDEIDSLRLRLVKARAVKQGMMQELLTGRTQLQPTKAMA